jgi:two-component system, NtrC family, sensor kinase
MSDQRQRARVLLVDDEPSLRAVYPQVLAQDYDVSVAATGLEALSVISERSDFDVILCDLTMPDMDGPALYSALSRQAPQLLPRVLFCTGGLISARMRDFAASIPNAFLDKPIALDALCEAIERVARGPAVLAGRREIACVSVGGSLQQ